MIKGAHVVVHSKSAEADRNFFRDILGFSSIDAGHGWLIFGLSNGESALHPAQANNRHELYLICDNFKAEIEALRAKGVVCSKVIEERWGSVTKSQLPGGGERALYETKHPRP